MIGAEEKLKLTRMRGRLQLFAGACISAIIAGLLAGYTHSWELIVTPALMSIVFAIRSGEL